MTRVPIAHTGHVLIDLGIFLGPMALIAGWLKLSDRRAARREGAGRRGGEDRSGDGE